MPAGAVSRPEEFGAVRDLLASAHAGPSALAVAGEAGIGKTTVWFAGVEQAREQGFRVLSARANETEAVLAYAAVADLLADVEPAVLDELPPVQRIAVDRILLRAGQDGVDTDQRVAAAALVSVVAALTANSPVLLAIDDVQWLDSTSRAVIEFAARRLTGPVAVFVTESTDSEQAMAAPWLQLNEPDAVRRRRVRPLSLGGVHTLITARLGRSLPRATVVRITEASGGNPFYAAELASAVDGQPGADAVLPATLAELMALRTGSFDDDAREVLLTAAAVAEPTVDLLAAATGRPVDAVVTALEHAERERVVTLDGNRVRFSHPLLARGVYTQASAGQRRRIHRALAQLESLTELKARHMALAAVSSDPEVLHALDAAAESARARGAPAAAAELLDMAIRLGGDTPARRLAAARNHLQAGDTGTARNLLAATVGALPTGPLRAVGLLLLAGIAMYSNRYRDAVAHLEDARASAAGVHPLLVRVLMMLSVVQSMDGRFDDGQASGQQALAHAETLGDASLLSQVLASQVTMKWARGEGPDEATLDRAVESEDLTEDIPFYLSASAVRSLMTAWAGRLDEAWEQMTSVRRRYAERADEGGLMAVAGYSALIEMWRGNFGAAMVIAEEAFERGEQLGGEYINLVPLMIRAVVAAHAGNEADARRDAAAALAIAERLGSKRMTQWPVMTLGFLAVSTGDYAAALDALTPLLPGDHRAPNTEIMEGWFLPDAVEAMVGLGRLAEAEPLIDALARDGRRLDRPWMLAVGGRCRGMWLSARGELDAALAVTHAAMAEHDRLPMPFERARTQLLLGQLQRRQRQKQSAAASMGEALRVFEELGAVLWADRARAELARTNVTRGATSGLTPSEQRIAELAASGMTNRDVAAALFISPKTVEHNLGRVYRKLGIRTRAELGRLMGNG